jgi:predicted nucleotide-binding protein (sugar kinase/HSP70/actin superfamily)
MCRICDNNYNGLKNLNIIDCPNINGLHELYIINCPNINELQDLYIDNCPNINELQVLYIDNCPNINKIQNIDRLYNLCIDENNISIEKYNAKQKITKWYKKIKRYKTLWKI